MRLGEARAAAHGAWLGLQAQALEAARGLVEAQLGWAGLLEGGGEVGGGEVFLDREGCLEFAVGRIGDVLGERWREVDGFPTRVRLPDEPLMLVDRIVELEGEALSMTSGRVVTEHDVYEGRWYLDGGRIPTAISIESGQADLFLSAWLGADFETRGLATYRLLDARCTFHDTLPRPGDTIRYDIRIERFFSQGETLLFLFRFDASVEGRPLMTMEDGCAGFFTAEALAAGRGVLESALSRRAMVKGKVVGGFVPLVGAGAGVMDAGEVDALRAGELGVLGRGFEGLGLRRPLTLPGGLLRLVHRVVGVSREGGRYGLGWARAEADIQPDDWFLTCHFVDDRVMPGTLMYECCLHTLRVYMLSLGWVGEEGEVVFEPVPGLTSRLQCRGQVLETTRVVTYEVQVKELGYRPAPYAIVDALMYADGKPIVNIGDMTLQLSGASKEGLEALWAGRAASGYTRAQIEAFASGRPSEGFGAAYEVFDSGERFIARLPQPPLLLVDRVVEAWGEPFVMKAGAGCVAEVEVAPGAWYFEASRQRSIPFAVLLEMALQPCGWVSAYVGSALTSAEPLHFRNLDGSATLHALLGDDDDVLQTRAELDMVSRSAGMIIHRYRFAVSSARLGGQVVYDGETTFGFFTEEALAQQVGIRGLEPWAPEGPGEGGFALPDQAPLPAAAWRMVARVDALHQRGGPHGFGGIVGSIQVDPNAWFFEAHFLQDPVWPGSLGLEAALQLLKVYALARWDLTADAQLGTIAVGQPHRWSYRGQITPARERVVVTVEVRSVDDAARRILADGALAVDGRVIYQLRDFAVQVVEG